MLKLYIYIIYINIFNVKMTRIRKIFASGACGNIPFIYSSNVV